MASSTLPELLRERAAQHPSALAIRSKRQGIWTSHTFAQVAGVVDGLAASLRELGFGAGEALWVTGEAHAEAVLLALAAHALGGEVLVGEQARGRPLRFVYAHDDHVLEHAYAALAVQPLGVEILLEPSLRRGALPYAQLSPVVLAHVDAANELDTLASDLPLDVLLHELLAHWLREGYALAFAETAATADYDRRELAPGLLTGTTQFYAALHARVLASLPAVGTLRRRLVDWALREQTGVARWLAEATVRHPLRDVLGLSRVQRALVLGALPAAPVVALFSLLGVSLRSAAQPSKDDAAAFEPEWLGSTP